MIANGLNSKNLVLNIFLVPNDGNSILSSNSGSVNFQEISLTQLMMP